MAIAWSSGAWVDVRDEGNRVVLRICGELDTESCDVIDPVVMTALATGEAVCLDLAQLTFCDSSGLAVLIVATQKAEANGSSLTIRDAPPMLVNLIDTAGLRDVIPIST